MMAQAEALAVMMAQAEALAVAPMMAQAEALAGPEMTAGVQPQTKGNLLTEVQQLT